jgi:hypothetical protein
MRFGSSARRVMWARIGMSILKTTTQHSRCDVTVAMSGISDYKTSHQTDTSHLTFIFL